MTPRQETIQIELRESGVPATLASLDWQGRQSYITSRGRQKAVIVGIPGDAFWADWQYKRDQVKADLAACNATLKRLHKGCWQVMVWENKHNQKLADTILVKIGRPF